MSTFTLPLPGFAATRALWPVWANSVRKPIRWAPMAKKAAVRLYHAARRFERQTRSYGRQDGALGRNGLAVLHALLFDFLHFKTGRLDPSIAAIAVAANISVSSAKRGLAALKSAGVLTWLRRCAEFVTDDGRFELRQETNAYAVQPTASWKGYGAPSPAPAPWGETYGAAPALPDALDLACAASGAGMKAAILVTAPDDPLAAALARLGQAIVGRKP